jgi:hypothetical protein
VILHFKSLLLIPHAVNSVCCQLLEYAMR